MESNNNDMGKIIRNVGLLIGVPLVILLIIWFFLNSHTPSVEKKILRLSGVF